MCWVLVAACGVLVLTKINPGPLHWEHGVLATEPPGKFISGNFFNKSKFTKREKVLKTDLSHMYMYTKTEFALFQVSIGMITWT